jgi:hypothetical protein
MLGLLGIGFVASLLLGIFWLFAMISMAYHTPPYMAVH